MSKRWTTRPGFGAIVAVAVLAGSAWGQDGATAKGPSGIDWDGPEAIRIGEVLIGAMEAVPEGERPEWLLMFADILRGSQLGSNDGWFRVETGGTAYPWERVRESHDADGDGAVAPGEWPGDETSFEVLDRDGDGSIGPSDFDWSAHALTFTPGMGLYYLLDADSNGKVTREEYDALFDRVDDEDAGFLSLDELRGLLQPGTMNRLMMPEAPKGSGPPPDPSGPDRATLVKALFGQELGALTPGPGIGEHAPDFTLETVDGDEEITLSEVRAEGERPVVLVFGNFTCGPFRSHAGNIEKLFESYRDRVDFVMIYVREAHPTDGWHMFDNFYQGYDLDQPTSYDGRVEVARTCQATLELDLPMLVDRLDDPVGTLYSGMPARLYLLDPDGRVAFKSGRGPFGFKPGALEQALILLLQDTTPAESTPAEAPNEPASAGDES